MSDIAATLPLLVPGTAVALLVSLVASGPIARWLGTSRFVAWVGVFSLGVIVASTLTPLDRSSFAPPDLVRACDFSRTWLAPLSEALSGSDASLNILLFLPLGWAIGFAPWSIRKLVVLAACVALPFAIEWLQLVLPPLGRGCESADVVDNLTGLVLGLAAGVLLAALAFAIRRLRAADDR